MEKREKLSSRLGFILLSAGCAIGVGNVWKFPWMCGQNGGGGFVLIYILCLLLLGLPVMTMEFSLGRAAQASPVLMYQKLEKKGQKWHIHGYASLLGNIALMAFYTVVAGWICYYFYIFLTGQNMEVFGGVNEGLSYDNMSGNTMLDVVPMLIVVVLAFIILCFNLQGGLERITKYIMAGLFIMMIAMAVRSFFLEGAAEGLKFYLLPDFSKINGKVVVAAMNQAFFTLSLGMGSMAIFGSYIDKERSLLGESATVIALDTLVALTAGLIMFPACTTYGLEVNAGPKLLFNTMATVFNRMNNGRLWGTLFFLFMVFAALSTVLAVCENITAMVRDLTGWKRPLACLVSGAVVTLASLTSSLGYNVIPFHPFSASSNISDLWDFIVNYNILPIGSALFALFCCNKFGWGWDNFTAEANTGKGWKVKAWMKPIFRYFVPVVIVFIYIYGLITFQWN